MLRIRTMSADDIPMGLALCRFAGWNQLETDWRRLLALEPDGMFIAEQDDRPCGTAGTTCYDTRTAWIGMVLVHPDLRRRGVGSALMGHCVRHLQGRGIQSIKLDATDDGRPVYMKLGFKDERAVHRYAGVRPQGLAADPAARAVQAADWPAVARIDETAFGADRVRLLHLLASGGVSAVLPDAGQVRGYGFARLGHEAGHLGPVVACDAEAARDVVRALLARLPDGPVFWDVLPDNGEAARLAESLGMSVARRLTRMYYGETMNPGNVDLVCAAAGFELG